MSAFVTYENILDVQLTDDLDEIGYDWKIFDFENGKYIIDVQRVFIVKSTEGFYYKLRFIDFYNQDGLKGYPKFEFQKL